MRDNTLQARECYQIWWQMQAPVSTGIPANSRLGRWLHWCLTFWSVPATGIGMLGKQPVYLQTIRKESMAIKAQKLQDSPFPFHPHLGSLDNSTSCINHPLSPAPFSFDNAFDPFFLRPFSRCCCSGLRCTCKHASSRRAVTGLHQMQELWSLRLDLR